MCVIFTLPACGSASEDAGPPGVGLRVTPAGRNVEVEAYPRSFEVIDKLGQPASDGEGHIHFYLDVEEIPTTPNKPAVTADEATYHAAATTIYVWKDVPSGKHTFGVQLVNNDHTPLEPPVITQQDVTVE